MARVMIAPAPLAKLQSEFLRVLRDAKHELVYPAKAVQMTEDDVIAQLPGIKGCLAGSEPYTEKALIALPDLKIIARAGVGFDAVDIAAATERGIVVTFAPGTNHDAVAEHTFMLILNLAKNFLNQHLQIQQGKWPRNANLPLRGRTLGVVGLGRIGKTVAMRGINFGMKIVAYEPMVDEAFVKKHDIAMMDFEQVMRKSDYVSLHVPLFPLTRHMINRESLSWMKPGAFLINTARGGLVNEPDLLDALANKRIAGAGLDVFDEEPPPADHPFFKLDNVVLTAHTAGVDLQSRDDMALSAATSIVEILRGDWPVEKIVNPEVKSKFKLNG